MLQEAALAHRFDVIVVTDLTRLSRSQGDLSKMIDRLTMQGIRIVGVNEDLRAILKGRSILRELFGGEVAWFQSPMTG